MTDGHEHSGSDAERGEGSGEADESHVGGARDKPHGEDAGTNGGSSRVKQTTSPRKQRPKKRLAEKLGGGGLFMPPSPKGGHEYLRRGQHGKAGTSSSHEGPVPKLGLPTRNSLPDGATEQPGGDGDGMAAEQAQPQQPQHPQPQTHQLYQPHGLESPRTRARQLKPITPRQQKPTLGRETVFTHTPQSVYRQHDLGDLGVKEWKALPAPPRTAPTLTPRAQKPITPRSLRVASDSSQQGATDPCSTAMTHNTPTEGNVECTSGTLTGISSDAHGHSHAESHISGGLHSGADMTAGTPASIRPNLHGHEDGRGPQSETEQGGVRLHTRHGQSDWRSLEQLRVSARALLPSAAPHDVARAVSPDRTSHNHHNHQQHPPSPFRDVVTCVVADEKAFAERLRMRGLTASILDDPSVLQTLVLNGEQRGPCDSPVRRLLRTHTQDKGSSDGRPAFRGSCPGNFVIPGWDTSTSSSAIPSRMVPGQPGRHSNEGRGYIQSTSAVPVLPGIKTASGVPKLPGQASGEGLRTVGSPQASRTSVSQSQVHGHGHGHGHSHVQSPDASKAWRSHVRAAPDLAIRAGTGAAGGSMSPGGAGPDSPHRLGTPLTPTITRERTNTVNGAIGIGSPGIRRSFEDNSRERSNSAGGYPIPPMRASHCGLSMLGKPGTPQPGPRELLQPAGLSEGSGLRQSRIASCAGVLGLEPGSQIGPGPAELAAGAQSPLWPHAPARKVFADEQGSTGAHVSDIPSSTWYKPGQLRRAQR